MSPVQTQCLHPFIILVYDGRWSGNELKVSDEVRNHVIAADCLLGSEICILRCVLSLALNFLARAKGEVADGRE